MIVDCAYYSRGVRQPQRLSLEEAASCPRRGNNFVWIELYEPEDDLMTNVSRLFGLHELAVEDASRAHHQRPKVDVYDDFYLIVYKAARYDEESKRVLFGELDVFLGAGFVIAVRHGEAGSAAGARKHLEHHPQLLHSGPAAVVWAILDTVVDAYRPVVDGLEGDVEALERAMYARRDELIEQVYTLKGEINEVYRAVHPLLAPLDAVERGVFPGIDPGLRRYFRDIADHVRRIQEEVLAQRDQLIGVLDAHLSLITLRQSEIATEQNASVGRLTRLATVFLPLTFITGFFGQNFGWLVRHVNSFEAFVVFGIGSLVIPCLALYVWFRRGGFV